MPRERRWWTPEDELTNLHLPGTGTVAQAALLLVERLVERLRPQCPGHPATGGTLVIGIAVPDGLVDELLAGLAAEYGRRSNWQRGYVEDISALRGDVLDLLARMRLMARTGQLRADGDGLPGGYADEAPEGRTVTDVRGARPDGDGWVLLAAAARYATPVTVRPASAARKGADLQEELPL
ncbi:DUF2398 family protein [Streptomyces sp. NPDC047002]|uniref:DUF2398 family protein n=1 Tax=Streptomyces sp. NPDC047002 TaxID=3155475 RepID=UPI003453593F